jgi:hypothetical protein
MRFSDKLKRRNKSNLNSNKNQKTEREKRQMSFKFGVDTKELEGRKPVPEGIYTVKLVKFSPKKNAKGDSVNLNPQMEIIDAPDGFERAMVFDSLSMKAAWVLPDFAHAFGFELEESNGEAYLPGDWDGAKEDPKTWKYSGPLLGATAQVEIAIDSSYDPDKPSNKIRKYICKLPGCIHKHSNDLMRKSS